MFAKRDAEKLLPDNLDVSNSVLMEKSEPKEPINELTENSVDIISPSPTKIIDATDNPTPTIKPTEVIQKSEKYVAVPLSLGYAVNCQESKATTVASIDAELQDANQQTVICASKFVTDRSCKDACNLDEDECEAECDAKNLEYNDSITCQTPCWNKNMSCKAECDSKDNQRMQNLANECANAIYKPKYDQLVKLISEYCQK